MSHYDYLHEDTTPDWEKKKREKEQLLKEWAEDAAKHHVDKNIMDLLGQVEGLSDKEADEIFNQRHDDVNHPKHYTSHPSGVECIQVTEHMSFCLGNAIKYLWRSGDKGNTIQDLEKAVWYIQREIGRLKNDIN